MHLEENFMSDRDFVPQDLPARSSTGEDGAGEGSAKPRMAYAPQSPFSTGVRSRCPRCGEGKLYKGLLEVRESCDHCGLDYSQVDSGDGPAVFVIFILGAVTVLGALLVDSLFAPPYWAHAIIWAPVIIGGSIGLLAPFKGVLIALQYHNKAREGRLDTQPGGQD